MHPIVDGAGACVHFLHLGRKEILAQDHGAIEVANEHIRLNGGGDERECIAQDCNSALSIPVELPRAEEIGRCGGHLQRILLEQAGFSLRQ